MKRVQLFEIEDQSWLPRSIRDTVTDFLQFAVIKFNLYSRSLERLKAALAQSKTRNIIDLCSGGGGAWSALLPQLTQHDATLEKLYLTDYFPNKNAFLNLAKQFPDKVSFSNQSISALSVPPDLKGIRTLFSSFHHFKPNEARKIIEDAILAQQPIAIFESTQRHPLMLIYMLLTPIISLLTTPFHKPFKFTRILWTYIIPVSPIIIMFDGVISCLRTYSPEEIRAMIKTIPNSENYNWQIGVDRIRSLPIGVTYAIGFPLSSSRRSPELA